MRTQRRRERAGVHQRAARRNDAGRALRLAGPILRIPGLSGLVIAADALVREALFDE
jgi:hypothetical protein